MQHYDVVIAGAGPAGGQCARELALKGKKVLLIDKAKTFSENNYSSGGAPLEVMQDFALPSTIVGSYWNKLAVASTHRQSVWQAPSPFGPVLDFDKLRGFLADEVLKTGNQVQLGCAYQGHQVQSNGVSVSLKNLQTQEKYTIKTRILVDATGSERKVLSQNNFDKENAMAVTGIEYHVRVQPEVYQQFAQSLNFYLGHHWMPQGYGWIFSMAFPYLKVGVIRYFQNKQFVAYHPSYHFYLERLLTLCGSPSQYEVVDKHGKTIYYMLGQKDRRLEGPVLAIGDAISAINPLGCEGIRHALASGRLAAQEIEQVLNGKVDHFNGYHQAMRRYFGYKWFFSERLMRRLFQTKQDRFIDKAVSCFGIMNNQEIIDVIFNYRFSRTIPAYLWYFFSRFK